MKTQVLLSKALYLPQSKLRFCAGGRTPFRRLECKQMSIKGRKNRGCWWRIRGPALDPRPPLVEPVDVIFIDVCDLQRIFLFVFERLEEID